jgi:hypothetical protein
MTGVRRLAVILADGVVGNPRLMGETRRSCQRVREVQPVG